MIRRICKRKECGKRFATVYPQKRFCSVECRVAASVKKLAGYHRKWYLLNKESVCSKQSVYRKAHPEVGQRSSLKFRAANLEKCRERDREHARRYYAANRAKIAERDRKYREANREKIAERQRRYCQTHHKERREHYAANCEQIRETARKRRLRETEEQRAKRAETNRLWREANRDYLIAKNRKYHADHRDEDNQRRRQWTIDNPQYTRRSRRQWYLANREEAMERAAYYRAANPDKVELWKNRARRRREMALDIFAELVGPTSRANANAWKIVAALESVLKEEIEHERFDAWPSSGNQAKLERGQSAAAVAENHGFGV